MDSSRNSALTWPLVVAAIVGLVVGILLTLVGLVAFAPQRASIPPAKTADPYAAVTVGDAFLTSQLADATAQAQLPVTLTNVRAHVETGNHLQLSADTSGLPTFIGAEPRRLTADLTLSVDAGQLHAHINQASVGGLNLPAPITSALESALNQKLASTLQSLTAGGTSYALVGVTSSPGRLTLLLQHR